ncbi:MAG TPA: helix-turn-helix domain-containing protein [Gemmatimonadales bacterium]|nr:helix-turn-helix domain-containing protein [Gemmatimonadales bacterium]
MKFRFPAATTAPLAAVSTFLMPHERMRVDAAGEGVYRTLHRESWDDIARDLREQRSAAVILSVSCAGPRDAGRVARVVREFPGIPAVALLSALDGGTPQSVLALGSCGVRRLIDVRSPTGWRELREVLALERNEELERRALELLRLDVPGVCDDCVRFFELIFRGTPRIATVRSIASEFEILPSTFMSRFFRARLPAPKRYLAFARLTRAARLFENPGLSIAAVANALEYSSPQSFGRHVRTLLGLTASGFRERYDGTGMLNRFRDELILPHRDTLRTFSPLRMPR